MAFTPPGGIGGGGGGGLHFRNPPDEFTGATLAACRTARNTAFSTGGASASFLGQYQGDQSLAIILNPSNSTDNVFETRLPGNSDGLRQTAKEFALHSASASARGMTVSATHAYVVDDSTERVNVYQLSDGARQTGSEFAIHSSNTWPVGIAINATDAYVADNANNKLFVYQLSDGARQTAKEFDLHSDNFRPSGVAVDATYAYVVDLDDHKMYVYQISDGARQAGREFDFDTDNTNPQGIAVDATYAYVVDQADGKLYVYRLSDGARIEGQEFGLDPANANARGIGVTAAFAYVVDFDDRKVYAYRLFGSYDSTRWLERTDAVQGNMGAQGRFEISIHINATAAPAAPTGGSYDTATGVLAPPTGWTEAPTVPGTGEDVYVSQAVIDPETQSGTVTPVWSVPVERTHLSAGITGLTAGKGLTGGGASGAVTVDIDPAETDFPTIPLDKGGTGAADAAAARAALAVLTQAQVDARTVARFSDAEKTKLSGLSAGGGAAVNLGTVTLSADRLTAAAPSGYSRYPDGTLLLFRVGTNPDSSWTGNLEFYIGTDRYDLHESGTNSVSYPRNFLTDTSYLAVVHNAVQLIGPLEDVVRLSGATFKGATGGIAPAGNTDFVTKGYADANYGGTLRSAAGAPAQVLGDNGDWYINRTTGGFYEKVSGAWELRYTDQVGAAGGLTQSQVDARADARIAVALGAAVTSNTETGIVVTYNSDGTIDFVIQAAAQTHTNFVGIIDGALSAVTATDFTVSGITEVLTIPAYSGTRRLLFARPSSESDPSAVYLYQSGNRNTVNQISIFVKSNTPIQLGGESHNWWGTADLQNGAGEYVLEQVN